MNAYAARALLSRIYLYHDDNEKAFQMASNLIEEVEGNGMYRLYTRDEYIPAWDLKNTFGTESLFEIANSTDDNGGRSSLAYLMHWNGYREILLLRNLWISSLLSPSGGVTFGRRFPHFSSISGTISKIQRRRSGTPSSRRRSMRRTG